MGLTRPFSAPPAEGPLEMATRARPPAASKNRRGTLLLWSMSVVASLCLTAPNARGEVYRFPLDQQIDIGRGSAIYYPASPHLTFESEPEGGFARMHLTAGNGRGGYYWGPYVSLPRAGLQYLDLSNKRSTVEFDARYFQSPSTNTNPYFDAPVFVILWDTDYKSVGTHAFYWRTYEWQHISFHPATYSPWYWGDPTINLSRITQIGFYGTDWAGTGDDYVDFKNLTISAVPEIDPAGVGSVVALITGGLALLERRRKRCA